MSNPSINIDNMPVACPKCGRVYDSIKCYSVPNYILFLGVYAAYEFKKEVCCPHCMRKQILIKYFTYNIIIGNFLWFLMGLPTGIWKLISSYTKGHSDTVKQILAENISDSSAHTPQETSHVDQYGNPIYDQTYNIKID